MRPNARGSGVVVGSQPMNTAVHRSPNKLLRSNTIFKLQHCVFPPTPAVLNKDYTVLLVMRSPFYIFIYKGAKSCEARKPGPLSIIQYSLIGMVEYQTLSYEWNEF
jgi:hypothetical protein